MSHYPAEVLEISHSTMGSYHSCPRKLEFSKFFKINMRGNSKAGDGGNAIHLGLGEYLLHKNREQAIYKFMLAYPISLCDNPTQSWSLESAYAALLSLMDYMDTHTHMELAVINGQPAIEVPFLINILHDIPDFMPVVYRGFIDLIFYDKIENKYVVWDLKNTARVMSDFGIAFKFDTQCVPYAIVLQRALDKTIKNLTVNYLVQPVNLTPDEPELLEFEKSEQDIQEWGQDLIMDLNNIKIYRDTGWFPRRSSACSAFNKACRYFELCVTRNPEIIKRMLLAKEQPPQKEFTPWITLDLELK